MGVTVPRSRGPIPWGTSRRRSALNSSNRAVSVRGPRRGPVDWPRLVSQLEALYRVGELHGLAAAKAWLTEHGIAWWELATPGAARQQAAAFEAGAKGELAAEASIGPRF
jgi:hypothetical protein